MKTLSFAMIASFLVTGCIQQIAINSLGGILDNGFEVLNEEEDWDLAEKTIPSNLKLLETIMRSDPENSHYLLLASRGYSSYALGFVEDDNPDRAKLLYLRAKEYGLRILRRHRDFAEAESRGMDEFRGAVDGFSSEEVPAVFWTAVGWGSYIQWSLTDPAALADLPKVEAMMQFVLRRDSSYYYGGAHFFLGTLDGSRSKILGGDLERSRDHFQRCLKINEERFLMTYVYYARSYAVQNQDQALFEQCLSKVDSTSLDVLPKARLSNAVAKRKAKLLRAKLEQLF